jgi:hypothetical protein
VSGFIKYFDAINSRPFHWIFLFDYYRLRHDPVRAVHTKYPADYAAQSHNVRQNLGYATGVTGVGTMPDSIIVSGELGKPVADTIGIAPAIIKAPVRRQRIPRVPGNIVGNTGIRRISNRSYYQQKYT